MTGFSFTTRMTNPNHPTCTAPLSAQYTGRMASRFGKGKGWKLLIWVQFLPAGQPSPDNKEISVPFRIMQQATARAAAESLNKGTFGTELGPKTCPVRHFPALATLHLSTADQEGCHQEQPWLTWSNRLCKDLKGCEKWNEPGARSEMSVPPSKLNKRISI